MSQKILKYNNKFLTKQILNTRKCYHEVFKALFSTKETATKCVTLRNFSKSQKMLKNFQSPRKCYHEVFMALFPTKKTATKCVTLQKFSKSQKMFDQNCKANKSPQAKAKAKVSWSSVNWLFLQKPVKTSGSFVPGHH